MSDPEAVDADARLQADPELDLSEGRATTGQIVLTGVAAAAIVVTVLYGLTHQRNETHRVAAPASQATTAAPPANPQQGKSQGANQQQSAQGNQGAQGNQQKGGNQPQANPQQAAGRDRSQGQAGTAPQTTGAAPSSESGAGAPSPAPPGQPGGPQKK
jgi:hypothetical protein